MSPTSTDTSAEPVKTGAPTLQKQSAQTPLRFDEVSLIQGLIQRGFIDDKPALYTPQKINSARQRLLANQASLQEGSFRASACVTEVVSSLGLMTRSGDPLDADRLAKIIATISGLSHHKIDRLKLNPELVTSVFPKAFAMHQAVLPLYRDGDALVIAIAHPYKPEFIEHLGRLGIDTYTLVIATKRDIMSALFEVYGFRQSISAAAKERRSSIVDSNIEQLVQLRSSGELDSSDHHVINAVDFLLRYALEQGASDLHIEPRRHTARVRLRIDGILHTIHTIPMAVLPAVTARIKTMARMDIAEKRRPQDGRAKTTTPIPKIGSSKETELRVSTLPTAFGEKTVIRLFDPEMVVKSLTELGMSDENYAAYINAVQKPTGMILITGPTGSGKTTTLYSTLRHISSEERNIVTVEDPIEMVMEELNQVAVRPKIDLSFVSALRAILRQDPDVIMVGEIRDEETAATAAQAAMTGHLLFSTLHTNDAISALTRLLDLGLAKYLVSASLSCVVAQRLARKLCEKCKYYRDATTDEQNTLYALLPAFTDTSLRQVADAHGCKHCRETGYRGRIGLYEVLIWNSDLLEALRSPIPEASIRQKLKDKGYRTLQDDAYQKLSTGVTSPSEIIAALGSG